MTGAPNVVEAATAAVPVAAAPVVACVTAMVWPPVVRPAPAVTLPRPMRSAPRASTTGPEATIAADDIDFEDELRIAVEERASLSPDALTGMEASLRFVGPETLETKIFGRLSAWQNWIFTRANSTGQHGALTLYGQPERPQFQWKRT